MKFMDMLYHRYACPMDLMGSYINRGRFGEFVAEFLQSEYERRKAEADKDDDLKAWIMYSQLACNGFTEESYFEWKNRVLKIDNKGRKRTTDEDLTDESIQAICDGLFPE